MSNATTARPEVAALLASLGLPLLTAAQLGAMSVLDIMAAKRTRELAGPASIWLDPVTLHRFRFQRRRWAVVVDGTGRIYVAPEVEVRRGEWTHASQGVIVGALV